MASFKGSLQPTTVRAGSRPKEERPTQQQADSIDMLLPLITAAHQEMSELSKKKQDGVLNALKVKTINRLLTVAKETLASAPSIQFLDLLDEETLPQNSDAALILSQFVAALQGFKNEHHGRENSHPLSTQRWFTQENP